MFLTTLKYKSTLFWEAAFMSKIKILISPSIIVYIHYSINKIFGLEIILKKYLSNRQAPYFRSATESKIYLKNESLI